MTHATPALVPSAAPAVPRRIAVLGAGTMGRAIATGVLRDGAAAHTELAISDRVAATAEALAGQLHGARAAASNADAVAGADLVLLCVKPKDVPDLLADLVRRGAFAHAPLLISIAAGVTIAAIEAVTGDTIPVVRAMPNTPSQVGRGLTVLSAGARATEAHLAEARAIFSAVGRCLTLEEKHLDAVTAVSASGCAFIYVVMEALADGGVSCGLPRAVAMEMVAQMTLGAAEMVLATGRHPASLKDDVTTPGGCTIAGLMTLEDGRVRSVMARAVETTTRVAAGLGR